MVGHAEQADGQERGERQPGGDSREDEHSQ
jgi:hypothetical protein